MMSLDRVLDNNWILDNSISCLEEKLKPFMAPAIALLFLERKALPLFLIIKNKNPKQASARLKSGWWGARERESRVIFRTMASRETSKENSWANLRLVTFKFLIIYWLSKK